MAGDGQFDDAFRDQLEELFRWRRDVRRFRRDSVDPALIRHLLELADLAPSVGLSQPWRFVAVEDEAARGTILASFERCNAQALEGYDGDEKALYARLKLEGLREAPVQFAVFSDEETLQGKGVGRQTMPETLRYSVVAAVYTFWLAARAAGLGVGWVSILEPEEISKALSAPDAWALVAYLCVGYPIEEHLDPELERVGWERRR
ncbi:MAG TPA: 5,6-dimethylbenzimidazole synthase [Rhizobiales bacterium]|nr:5,6-dimethylbenzimidazole synthase [bacterium BMS3Bbin10]HDO51692.1 5,6-dimethylbenzimidazole synthase [Hyphomicrobiales bacterium]